MSASARQIVSKMHFSKRLIYLINQGKNEEAKLCIDKYNLRSIDKLNLLHLVALDGNLEMTEFLLSKGWDVNGLNSYNYTPLMCVLLTLPNANVLPRPNMWARHEPIIKILLDAGADMYVTTADGRSVLQIFLSKCPPLSFLYQSLRDNLQRRFQSREEIVMRLIKAGCRLDQALLLKDSRIFEYMLKNGYRSDLLKPCAPEQIGMTLLHLAALINHVESVKILLKYNADIDAKDAVGITPLFYVYGSKLSKPLGRLETFKVLLNAKPTIDIMTTSSTLARGSREAISLLLDLGLEFDKADPDGKRALHYLAMNHNPGVVDELKLRKVKFDVDATVGETGRNSLHFAAACKNVEMLKFLLESGANVESVDNRYQCTSLFHAYVNHEEHLDDLSDQCVEILLQHNANTQVLAVKDDGPKTIYDIKTTGRMNDRLKLIVAHTALWEKRGTPITETINFAINSRPSLKSHFEKCRQLLNRKVAKGHRDATVLKFLTANEKTVARHLRQRVLLAKLIRISHSQELKSSYPFYYNTLKNRMAKVLLNMTLKDKAAVLISDFFRHRLDKSNIVVDKIISYLDESNLRLLYQI